MQKPDNPTITENYLSFVLAVKNCHTNATNYKTKVRTGGVNIGNCVVQSVSLFRLVAAMAFASIAFQDVSIWVLGLIYFAAMCSDLLDGFLARRLRRESFAGKVIDLVSDKSLTVVSILYAAERGIHFLPLAMIAIREVVILGMRLLVVNGTQILATNRMFGGIMAFLIWSNTLILLFIPPGNILMRRVDQIYSVCAAILILNLIVRINKSRNRIKDLLSNGE